MDQVIEWATRLRDAGVAVVLISLLIVALLIARFFFNWGRACQEARLKESQEREAHLFRVVEANTTAAREQARATEADAELQKANRLLLEQLILGGHGRHRP